MIYEVPEKKAFDTPILGVFGTSSQQGKFTLQLALRYELQKRGFKVGQIGTEHQSGCFGIDFTFPSGYGMEKSITIPLDYHIPILRRVLSEMDKVGYDVIIVGAQSGILNPNPYYYGNIVSEFFFTATIPDRTILIKNNFDDTTFLDRTRNYIYAKTGQKTFEEFLFEELKKSDFKSLITKLTEKIINL